MSDAINAHDLGVAGGYIIETAMQETIDQLKAENAKLRELVSETVYDGYGDAVGWVARHACRADETDRYHVRNAVGRPTTIHVIECSACGGTYEHVNGSYEFCPRCGRKVVDQ